jgi:hypothetical protein
LADFLLSAPTRCLNHETIRIAAGEKWANVIGLGWVGLVFGRDFKSWGMETCGGSIPPLRRYMFEINCEFRLHEKPWVYDKARRVVAAHQTNQAQSTWIYEASWVGERVGLAAVVEALQHVNENMTK